MFGAIRHTISGCVLDCNSPFSMASGRIFFVSQAVFWIIIIHAIVNGTCHWNNIGTLRSLEICIFVVQFRLIRLFYHPDIYRMQRLTFKRIYGCKRAYIPRRSMVICVFDATRPREVHNMQYTAKSVPHQLLKVYQTNLLVTMAHNKHARASKATAICWWEMWKKRKGACKWVALLSHLSHIARSLFRRVEYERNTH